MAVSKFDICSNALLRIGAQAITDFDGGSAESTAAAQFWQTTTDNWLTLHDWHFAGTTALLSRLAVAPLQAWDAAYQQPAEAIKIRSVKVNDLPIPFDRFQDKIHCNALVTDSVYCDYTWAVQADYWPPYFVELMELALAKKFAFTLAAKLDLKSVLDSELDIQFRLAKNADARQQTTKKLRYDGRGSIMEARRA